MGVAIVTGAGRGIGRETAIALAGHGYDVVVTARSADQVESTAATITDASGRAVVVVGDVADQEHVDQVTSAARELGSVELLVNNAGTASSEARLWESDLEDWWRVVTTNVRGPALMCAAVIPGMVAAGSGRIVNLNSLGGVRAFPTQSAYSVSKAALSRLTDCLTAELDGTGVVVFDLSPGLVRTSMSTSTRLFDDVPDEDWTPMDAAVSGVLALASGRYDELAGRFVRATDDLDDLVERIQTHHDGRRLRLTAAGDDDPLFD